MQAINARRNVLVAAFQAAREAHRIEELAAVYDQQAPAVQAAFAALQKAAVALARFDRAAEEAQAMAGHVAAANAIAGKRTAFYLTMWQPRYDNRDCIRGSIGQRLWEVGTFETEGMAHAKALNLFGEWCQELGDSDYSITVNRCDTGARVVRPRTRVWEDTEDIPF
jgi:hypothetical protein